mgnify:CR=1 FL=1
MQNYFKNSQKNCQNPLLCISGPDQLAHAKKKGKTTPKLKRLTKQDRILKIYMFFQKLTTEKDIKSVKNHNF